jgi:hypothetical protein
MKPHKDGIWEWFEKDGTKRLVRVFDVGLLGNQYLRVYWWGGYYNVKGDPFEDGGDEWPDRWGNYIGSHGTVSDDKIYDMPTHRQRAEIFKKLQK